MNRDREARDLAPLDPRGEPRRWEAMVQGINRAAAGEIARRSVTPEVGVTALLSRWRRPAFALYGAVAAAAAAILLLQPRIRGSGDTALEAALGYPEPVAEWVAGGDPPSVEELLFTMEGVE